MVPGPRAIVTAAVGFGYFGFGSVLCSWVVLPLATAGLRDPDEAIRRSQRVVSWGFRSFHAVIRATGRFAYDPDAAGLSPPDGPCVLVSNHPTLIDVTALLATLVHGCAVVRHDLYRSVFWSSLMRRVGNIDAGDGGVMAGGAVISEALDRLRRGHPVLMFPEGSRSPAGGLRRFRKGAFDVACRAGAPVVAYYLSVDPPTLTKGTRWYALSPVPSVMTVELLGRFDPGDHGSDPARLLAAVEVCYRERLARWREERQKV